MQHSHNNKLQVINEKTCEELYIMETIVNLTKKTCQDFEFQSEYYGASANIANSLSIERNHYINMLNLLSERMNNVINLCISAEHEITLL